MFLRFTDIAIHILLVSVPEAMFVVSLYLIISNRFDLLELKLDKVARFFVPVLTVSLSSNLLRIYIPESVNYMPIVSILLLLASTMLTYRISKSLEILKMVLAIIFSYMVGVFIQLSYVPLLLYGTSLELSHLNTYSPTIIIWTIPERVIEITLIAYLLIKKKEVFRINILKEITSSRILTAATGSMIIVNITFMWIMVKLICFNYLLQGLPFITQVTTIALVLVLPLLNMAFLWIIVYHIKQKESFEKLMTSERLKTLTSVLGAYANTGNYDKISLVLNDLKNHSSQLFDDSI